MKKIILLLFINLIINSCKAQCNNELAINQFEKDLQIVTSSIQNPNSNLKELPSVIQRIEKVTSIESESDGNYLGKFNPTTADTVKWKNWFENNKSKLCWNKKDNHYDINKNPNGSDMR